MDNIETKFSNIGKVKNWHELIEAICNRPCMFTVEGTFNEVCAWLQGFVAGLDENNDELTDEWSLFVKWLQRRFKFASNIAWCHILKLNYPREEKRISALLSLYNEFTNSSHKRSE